MCADIDDAPEAILPVISGRPITATASAPQIARRVPNRATALPANNVVTTEGIKTK